MSLVAQYHNLQKEIERLQAARASLQDDPALKAEMEFESKLRSLMADYGKSLPDIISIIAPSGEKPEVTKKRKSTPRKVKIYRNPLTNEVVESKGGNHKLLQDWKVEFGATEVESWVEQPDQSAA
jgi:hypothetical protein